jgi:hypothetical protein
MCTGLLLRTHFHKFYRRFFVIFTFLLNKNRLGVPEQSHTFVRAFCRIFGIAHARTFVLNFLTYTHLTRTRYTTFARPSTLSCSTPTLIFHRL